MERKIEISFIIQSFFLLQLPMQKKSSGEKKIKQKVYLARFWFCVYDEPKIIKINQRLVSQPDLPMWKEKKRRLWNTFRFCSWDQCERQRECHVQIQSSTASTTSSNSRYDFEKYRQFSANFEIDFSS